MEGEEGEGRERRDVKPLCVQCMYSVYSASFFVVVCYEKDESAYLHSPLSSSRSSPLFFSLSPLSPPSPPLSPSFTLPQVTAVKVSDKTCRHTDYDAFPCDSWFAGGHAERYDPPFMYGDTDDLATQKPTGFQVRRGRGRNDV